MKRVVTVGLVWMAVLSALSAVASVQLNIPPRRQWDNGLGYCGECSVQQAALYYGTYISQYQVRGLVDPTQQRDVRLPENAKPIFQTLGLTYKVWNSKQAKPQYQAYLVWIKIHLDQEHPVLMDMFNQGGANPKYDHIVVVTGFSSRDATTYHADDILIFNDNFWGDPIVRPFGTLQDTRSMSGNGALYSYCIPYYRNTGMAVTGVRDVMGQARHVSLKLDRWDEPNLSQGEAPVRLNAKIKIRGLTPGTSYTLLRYDDPRNVPTRHYQASHFNRIWVFKAAKETQLFSDSFMSDGIVIYRCVPTIIE